jgi:hypothetical protein
MTPTFTKGMQCLDKLLKLDETAIGPANVIDLMTVRRAVMEMKSELELKSRIRDAESKTPMDESLFYFLLHDVIATMYKIVLDNRSAANEDCLGKAIICFLLRVVVGTDVIVFIFTNACN